MATASNKDTVRMMVIDGEKLRRELKKRGLKSSVVSTELGCSSSYLSYSMGNNIIAKQTALALEAMYNIKKEDIRPDTVIEKSTINEECEDVLNQELYNTVFKAIKDAFMWYANQGR